jgi:hypothetical protein
VVHLLWCRTGHTRRALSEDSWIERAKSLSGFAHSDGGGFCIPLPPAFLLTISRPEHSVLRNAGFQMSARLRAASLFALITVVAVSVRPKVDLPETEFDETDAPTTQAVVTSEAASSKGISSGVASAPIPFARTRKARVRSISPAYTAQSSDPRQFREGLCTLRC